MAPVSVSSNPSSAHAVDAHPPEKVQTLTKVDSLVDTDDHDHSHDLSKVDSNVDSPDGKSKKRLSHRRTSSSAGNVRAIEELEKEKIPIELSIETQQLGW